MNQHAVLPSHGCGRASVPIQTNGLSSSAAKLQPPPPWEGLFPSDSIPWKAYVCVVDNFKQKCCTITDLESLFLF